MKRSTSTRVKATATLALACTTALVFAVATVQARPTHTAGPQAATAALSDCTIVITAAPWRYLSLAGNKYTLKARAISCSGVRARVLAFTKQKDTGHIKGPADFTCHSLSTTATGDTLLYSGVCMHGPHNDPSSGGARKCRDTEPTFALASLVRRHRTRLFHLPKSSSNVATHDQAFLLAGVDTWFIARAMDRR
jgi:hypothetical protein